MGGDRRPAEYVAWQKQLHERSSREYRNDHDLWCKVLKGEIPEAVFLGGVYDRQFYEQTWHRVKAQRQQARRKRGGGTDEY